MSVPQILLTPVIVTPDGTLDWGCTFCGVKIRDGEGGLLGQTGEVWRAYCYVHEPPLKTDEPRARGARQSSICGRLSA
jgi:hypothetical protein